MHQNFLLQAIIHFEELIAHMLSHIMDFYIKQLITSTVTFAIMAAIFMLPAKHKDNISSLCNLIKKMLVVKAYVSFLIFPANTILKLLL